MAEWKKEAVRAWLLDYAWMGSDDEKERTVDCIMAQDGWEFISAVADKYAGAQEETGPKAFADGEGFALSALYECHDGPHLPTCPAARDTIEEITELLRGNPWEERP